VHVKDKLNTTLREILMASFNSNVITNPNIKIRIDNSLKALPRDSNPSMIMLLVKGLYELDKGISLF
jgi:hypothetical protein